MLWPSMRRWKFQRTCIGKLPASDWCLMSVCGATSAMLAVTTAPSSASVPPCWLHSVAGVAFGEPVRHLAEEAEQRRLWNTPISAVASVITAMRLHARCSARRTRSAFRAAGRACVGCGYDEPFEESEHGLSVGMYGCG